MLFHVYRSSERENKLRKYCFPIKMKNGFGIIEDYWGIEINTIEELMKFKKHMNEDLILSVSYIDHKTPCIEIYDDYRE